QLALWHKALKNQWSANDLDWQKPVRMTAAARKTLARILTPILMGEQSALYSVSSLIDLEKELREMGADHEEIVDRLDRETRAHLDRVKKGGAALVFEPEATA
ncbi:MAG: hypothetical protein HY720_18925, partial [Planctomycetes bacterium]|nr:hypothetical protein [Planctomycetota bacterium]